MIPHSFNISITTTDARQLLALLCSGREQFFPDVVEALTEKLDVIDAAIAERFAREARPVAHERTVCVRDVARTQYVGKGYKSIFRCPTCGRESWQALNFLARKNLTCDGVTFLKEAK